PTGQFATTKFIYPELGGIDPKANKSERLKQLADLVTARKDGRLTRTIVNRLWARFMGRGLIEPADEMDNPAWNQDLLDWLAEEPKWIWKDPGAAASTEALTLYWRKEFDLPGMPAEAVAVATCDNSFKLFVNGKETGSGNDHAQPRLLNLKPHLAKGKNLIAI